MAERDLSMLTDEDKSSMQDSVQELQNNNVSTKEEVAVEEKNLAYMEDHGGLQAKLEELVEPDVLTNLGMNSTPGDQARIPENASVTKTELMSNMKNSKGDENCETEAQLNECQLSTLPDDLGIENNVLNTEVMVLMKEDLDFCPDLKKAVKEHCSQGEEASSKSVILSSADGSLLNINIGCISSEIAEKETENTDEDELSSSEFIDCDSQNSTFLSPTNTTVVYKSMNQNEDLELYKDSEQVETVHHNEDEVTSLESEAFNSCEDSSLDASCAIVNTESSESPDLHPSSEENKVDKLESDVSACLPCLSFSPQNDLLPYSSTHISEGLDVEEELGSFSYSEGHDNEDYESDKYNVECSGQFSIGKDILLNPENDNAVHESTSPMETVENVHHFDDDNYLSCDEISEEITSQSCTSSKKQHFIMAGHLGSTENSVKQVFSLSHEGIEPDKQEENCDFEQKDDQQFEALLEQSVDEKLQLSNFTLEKDLKTDDYVTCASTESLKASGEASPACFTSDNALVCVVDHKPVGTFQSSCEDVFHEDSGDFASSDNSLSDPESDETDDENVETENCVFEQKDDQQFGEALLEQGVDEKLQLSSFTLEKDLKPDDYVTHASTETMKAAGDLEFYKDCEQVETVHCNEDDVTSLESEAFNSCEDSSLDASCAIVNAESSESPDLHPSSEENKVDKLESDVSACLPCLSFSPQNNLLLYSSTHISEGLGVEEESGSFSYSEGHDNEDYESDKYNVECSGQFSIEKDILLNPENDNAVDESTSPMETVENMHHFDDDNYLSCDEISEEITSQSCTSSKKQHFIMAGHLGSAENSVKQVFSLSHKGIEPDKQEDNCDFEQKDDQQFGEALLQQSVDEKPQLSNFSFEKDLKTDDYVICASTESLKASGEASPACFTSDNASVCVVDHKPVGTFQSSGEDVFHEDSGDFASSDNSLSNPESDENVETENCDFEQKDYQQFGEALLEQGVDEKLQLSNFTLEKDLKPDDYVTHANTESLKAVGEASPGNAITDETVHELYPVMEEMHSIIKSAEIKNAAQSFHFDENVEKEFCHQKLSSEHREQTLLEDSLPICGNLVTEVFQNEEVMSLESKALTSIGYSCSHSDIIIEKAVGCKNIDPVSCGQTGHEQCNEGEQVYLEQYIDSEEKGEVTEGDVSADPLSCINSTSHEQSPLLNFDAVAMEREAVETKIIFELQCSSEANSSEHHKHVSVSKLNNSIIESMDLVNSVESSYTEVMENSPLLPAGVVTEEISSCIENHLGATKEVELDKQTCNREGGEISEQYEQDLISSEQESAFPLAGEPLSDSKSNIVSNAMEFKNVNPGLEYEQCESEQIDAVPSLQYCTDHEEMYTSLKTLQSEETHCTESTLREDIPVNITDVQSFTENTKLQMELELHLHHEFKQSENTEPLANISLIRNIDCEGSTFKEDSLMNDESNLMSETLKLQDAENCEMQNNSTTEPAFVLESSGRGSECHENAKENETISMLKSSSMEESCEPATTLQNGDVYVSKKDAVCKPEIGVNEVREQEENFDNIVVPLECEIDLQKSIVAPDIVGNVQSLCAYGTDIAETVAPDEVTVNICNDGLFVAFSGQEECNLTTAEVPIWGMERNTYLEHDEEKNGGRITTTVELEESTDCVDFVRATLHCDHTVSSETTELGEAASYANTKQDQEVNRGDGLPQEQSLVLTAVSLCSDEYSPESDETLHAREYSMNNTNENSNFACDDAETNSSVDNSEGNSLNSKTENFIAEVPSAAQCHDLTSNIQTQELACPLMLSEVNSSVVLKVKDEDDNHYTHYDKNGNKISQWSELSPGKLKHIDWEWRCKILEEEKSKLCEQNKYLQSELQLHLEKETSISVELDRLKNEFIESKKKFHSLENENLSLVSDCEKMKIQLEMSLKAIEDGKVTTQCVEEKDKEIAELQAQLMLMTEQHNREMKEAELHFQEATTDALTCKVEINSLKEQNLSLEKGLASCKEMADSLNSTLCEVTGSYEEQLEENKSLNDALDQEKSLNSKLSSSLDSLSSLVADQNGIIENLKYDLVTAENTVMCQSIEIKDLQMVLSIKEGFVTEQEAVIRELQKTADSAKCNVDNISTLLTDLENSICAHESALSCESENCLDVNALYCDIETSDDNILQLIKVISAGGTYPEDCAVVVSNFNMYITSIQRLLWLQKHALDCLKATCDVKDNELSEIRFQMVKKDNELNISHERLREANFTVQQQIEKLQQAEQDLFSKTSQLHEKDTRLAELDNELRLKMEAFQEDIQNLEKYKEALVVELEQKSSNIIVLQQEIYGLKEILYQNEQSLEQKSDTLFSAEEKVVEVENLLEEKNKALETMQKRYQEDENKIQEFQSELIEINNAVLHLLDEICVNPQVKFESLPTDKSAKMLEDKAGEFSLDTPKDEVENELSPSDTDLEIKSAEAQTADKELVSDLIQLNELIRSGTCSTLSLIKHSFAAIRKRCFGLEKEHHVTLVSLENNVKELKKTLSNIEDICSPFMKETDDCVEDTLRAAVENIVAMKELCNNLKSENSILKSSLSDKEGLNVKLCQTLSNIEDICSPFMKEADDCVEDALRAAVENIVAMKELCNNLKSENSILKSSLSNKEEAFLAISNELETIENMIGLNSKERNLNIDHSVLCLRLSHIADSLQNMNSTSLPEFLKPVLNETEEAINEIFEYHNRTIPHSTVCEKVKLIFEMLSEFREKSDTAARALHEKEQQYVALCSILTDIEEEFNEDSTDATCADVQLRAEKLLGKIQADKLLNQERTKKFADCERTMLSLQAVVDNITEMLRKKLKRAISETQLSETIKYLLDKKSQLEDEVNKGKSHFESCNKLMEYFKNQINMLEETNSELKANAESYKNTLQAVCQEKNDLEKSFNEKLSMLSAEISTLTDANAKLKAKSEKLENLRHNYKEQIASLKKVQLQLNNTIEEIEEELQSTYANKEELKTQLNNITAETENLKKAMSTDCKELESTGSLVLLYDKIMSSLKMENQELIQKINDTEKEVLESCNEKKNLSFIVSELKEELKYLQDSELEKNAEIENLKSKLKSKDSLLLEVKAEFEACEVNKFQLNSIFQEVKEKLHKVDAERQSLFQDNENLLSEIETLKQEQLCKDKTISNAKILEEEMEKLNETCKFLRQSLHKKDEELDQVINEKEQLLKDINKVKKEIDISYSKEKKCCEVSEENKLLNDQVKELECRVIEIEDENLSAYEKLDTMEREKNEVEKKWLHKCRTYNEKVEALNIKVSELNKELFKTDAEEKMLDHSGQLSSNSSEPSGKNTGLPSESLENVSDLESGWKAISSNLDKFHMKFLDFTKNTESLVDQKNKTEENLSLTKTELERYRHEIHDWRNVHQKIMQFMSDCMAEMNVSKSVVKSNSEGALFAGVCESNAIKDLQAIKVHMSQINRENSHIKLEIEQREKQMSELKGKNSEISQEYETVKKKNMENTSQLVSSQLKIERLTEEVKCLQKANLKLREETSTLHSKVGSLKQKEQDFLLKDNEMRNKVKILSSELTDLLNEKKTLEYQNNVLAAKLNGKKETDIVSDLEQCITCLKQKVNEYENEISQLKAEKQQYEILHSLEISDMTVKLPTLGLFSEAKSSHHPSEKSKKTDLVANSIPNSCDDNFIHEAKRTVATILQILCIEDLNFPLNKQLDLIKDKITSVLENSTTSFQLAKQLCKEISPRGSEFEGKSPSDLLHTLGSKFKDQHQLISDINRNIYHHIQTMRYFLKGMCELLQILRHAQFPESANTYDFGKAFEHFEHVVKGVDNNHAHTALGPVDSILQKKILPLVHAMKSQVVRKTGGVVNEELMQERQKVAKLETKLEELTKANVKLEGKLRLCLFNAKQMEKSYISLQQEHAALQTQVGHKENVDTQITNEVKELQKKLSEMEKKYEHCHDELCETMEKLIHSTAEISNLRNDCERLTACLHRSQRQPEQSKGPQTDSSASSKDSSGEKDVTKKMSNIPRQILSSKGNNVPGYIRTFRGKGEPHQNTLDAKLLPRNPPDWD